jgi:ribosomal protein S27AE
MKEITNMKKSFVEKWKELLQIEDEHPFTAGNIPGGIRRKKCPSCGGTIIRSGRGVIREICGDCSKPYHEPIYK